MEAGPAAEAPAGPTIGDLPPALLGRILSLTGRSADIGPTVTLVSHTWRDAFYSEPAFWSCFRLDAVVFFRLPQRLPQQSRPSWLASQLELLQRVAPLVTALDMSGVDTLQQAADLSPAVGSAERFLELVRPAALERLHLSHWSAMPPGLLARYSNLRSLSLQRCGYGSQTDFTVAGVQEVCSLSQLTALSIAGVGRAPQLLAAVADGLPQLRRLDAACGYPVQHAGQLTRLTSLQHLRLWEGPSEETQGGLQPPAPAHMPGLQSYSVERAAGRMQFPGAHTGRAAWREQVAPDGPSSAGLELWCIGQLTCLADLLDAMAPPGSSPLSRLALQGRLDVPPGAVALEAGSTAARRLAALQQLRLHLWPPGGSLEALLHALLPCTGQQLTCLELHGGLAVRVPPCVVQLTGLRRLALHDSRLRQLPSGPYLEGVEELDLRGSGLATLPPGLPTSLTYLELSFSQSLALSGADVNCLLSLPRLATLRMYDTATSPAATARLRAGTWLDLGLLSWDASAELEL